MAYTTVNKNEISDHIIYKVVFCFLEIVPRYNLRIKLWVILIGGGWVWLIIHDYSFGIELWDSISWTKLTQYIFNLNIQSCKPNSHEVYNYITIPFKSRLW